MLQSRVRIFYVNNPFKHARLFLIIYLRETRKYSFPDCQLSQVQLTPKIPLISLFLDVFFAVPLEMGKFVLTQNGAFSNNSVS